MLANEAQAPKPTAAADAAQPMFEEAQPPAVHATEAQGPSVAQPGLGESRDATGETQLTDAAEPGMGDSRDAGLAAEILAAQQEASKQRLAMISFRTGSWRESTPRGFPLRLMTVYLPPVVRLPPPEQPEPQVRAANSGYQFRAWLKQLSFLAGCALPSQCCEQSSVGQSNFAVIFSCKYGVWRYAVAMRQGWNPCHVARCKSIVSPEADAEFWMTYRKLEPPKSCQHIRLRQDRRTTGQRSKVQAS